MKPSQDIQKSGPRLAEALVGRTTLDALRAGVAATHESRLRGREEPDWKRLATSLRCKYHLAAEDADELARGLERLWLLPFHRYEEGSPLLVYRYAELSTWEARFSKSGDRDGMALAAAFRKIVDMMLQGVSVFPGDPIHLARQVMAALPAPQRTARASVMPIVRLLNDGESAPGFCGYNRTLCEDPHRVALYEHAIAQGRYEGVVKNLFKMEHYQRQLEANPRFRQEWEMLKRAFREVPFRDARGIVRRTPIPERNWRRDPPTSFRNRREAFQAAFDLFCWKWFLYGMSGDEPLVQKPFYVFTPYGMQLFIPGYWSFDAVRDFDWKEITRLHRARGVERQGVKLDRNKEQLTEQVRRLRDANRMARALGLHGEKRMVYLKRQARLSTRTDDGHIRRLLRSNFAR